MSNEPIRTFSSSAMDRIAKAVRKVEGMSSGSPSDDGMVDRTVESWVRVKITGPKSGGRYPGVIVYKNTPEDSYDTGEIVKVVGLNGELLKENLIYRAGLIGVTSDSYWLFDAVATYPLETAEIIELDYVSKICFTYSSYGTGITGATVEHKKIRVLGVPLPTETYCTTDDDDCCPTVTVPCCDVPLPRCFKIAFANGTGYWACLTGYEIYLTFNPATESWELGDFGFGGGIKINGCSGNDISPNIDARIGCGLTAGTLFVDLVISYGDTFDAQFDCLRVFGSINSEYQFQCHACAEIIIVPGWWPPGDYSDPNYKYYCGLSRNGTGPVTSPLEWTGLAINCYEGHEPPGEGSGGTVDIVIEPIDCDEFDGVDNRGGDDPLDESGCCTESTSLVFTLNGTDDYELDSDVGVLTYDPAGIALTLSGGDYDGQFQWYIDIHGDRFFYGCKDGVAYFGYMGTWERADCPGFTSHDEGLWWIHTADSYSCEGSIAATLNLATAGIGCTGTIEFTVTR